MSESNDTTFPSPSQGDPPTPMPSIAIDGGPIESLLAVADSPDGLARLDAAASVVVSLHGLERLSADEQTGLMICCYRLRDRITYGHDVGTSEAIDHYAQYLAASQDRGARCQ